MKTLHVASQLDLYVLLQLEILLHMFLPLQQQFLPRFICDVY
jgi:hypothetical protein